MNKCLKVHAPEDVFSKIVNRHHEEVKTYRALHAQEVAECKARRRDSAVIALVSAGLLLLGFLCGCGVPV